MEERKRKAKSLERNKLGGPVVDASSSLAAEEVPSVTVYVRDKVSDVNGTS